MAKSPDYISQWHQLFEQFETSSLEFYGSVEKAVKEWGVPEIHSTRVEHKEAGLASAKRIYLRMHRGKYAFDICAAPFGTGFFISWWLTEPPLAYGFLYTLLFFFALMVSLAIAYSIGATIGLVMYGVMFAGFLGLCFSVFGVPAGLWLLGNALRRGNIQGESTILAMPIVGWIYERVFAPTTYYSMDTALMFQDAIHKAVLDVLDCMTTAKGLRALSEAERKPILKRFAASV
jgi:hypothetical protein